MEKRYLTVPEAAEYLSMPKRSLYNALGRGLLPHTRAKGIGIRIDKVKLDQFLVEHEVIPVQDQVESWQ